MRAYVLITVQGDPRPVAEKIRALTLIGVKSADAVWGGSKDIIAVVEADNAEALYDAGPRIREITGVVSMEVESPFGL